MKKVILLFTLMFGIGVAVNAQAKPAEFKFDKETFDFGMIVANKPAVVDFKFTNTGDEPLIITKVETSCGCTASDYTKTPVKKGGTGVITVTYNPTSTLPFNKSITILSNAKTSTKVLYIKGNMPPATTK